MITYTVLNTVMPMCVLGGHMINDWRANTVTHLVMDGLTFTIKVSTLQLCTYCETINKMTNPLNNPSLIVVHVMTNYPTPHSRLVTVKPWN